MPAFTTSHSVMIVRTSNICHQPGQLLIFHGDAATAAVPESRNVHPKYCVDLL